MAKEAAMTTIAAAHLKHTDCERESATRFKCLKKTTKRMNKREKKTTNAKRMHTKIEIKTYSDDWFIFASFVQFFSLSVCL